MCIVLVGIDRSCTTSPTIYFTLVAPPGVVPTPTDWGPLKYTISFFLDSNFLVFTGILIWLFNTWIVDPRVWAMPIPPPSFLCTLITFRPLYKFNTLKSSDPTLNDPPTETVLGISVT